MTNDDQSRLIPHEKLLVKLNLSDPWMRLTINFFLRRDNNSICLHLAYAIFLGFSLFLTFYHTPWRDEAQAWLMARDLSVWGLFLEARHDGHPILWHLCLKVIQAFGFNYLGMLALNWVFMAFAIWLLFYRSGIPLIARVAVALCPACLLEVSYMARNYAISAALIFLAAILYRNAPKRPLAFSVVLALTANTNLYAAAVFVGISFQFLLEQGFLFSENRFSVRPIFTRYLLGNLILLAGALLLLAQLASIPLAGEPTIGRPSFHYDLSRIHPLQWLLLFMPVALVYFKKSPGCPRIFGGILSTLLVLVPAGLYRFETRHAFMLVLETVYFIWIYLDDIVPKKSEENSKESFSPLILPALFVIVACAACQWGGLKMVFKYQFDGKRAAQAIIAQHLDRPDTLLVTTNPTYTTSVLLHLQNIRSAYGPPPFPSSPESFADFFFTRMSTHAPTLGQIKPLVLNVAKANPGKTIIAMSVDSTGSPFDNHDSDYPLVPIYLSPIPPLHDINEEFFQVYLLK